MHPEVAEQTEQTAWGTQHWQLEVKILLNQTEPPAVCLVGCRFRSQKPWTPAVWDKWQTAKDECYDLTQQSGLAVVVVETWRVENGTKAPAMWREHKNTWRGCGGLNLLHKFCTKMNNIRNPYLAFLFKQCILMASARFSACQIILPWIVFFVWWGHSKQQLLSFLCGLLVSWVPWTSASWAERCMIFHFPYFSMCSKHFSIGIYDFHWFSKVFKPKSMTYWDHIGLRFFGLNPPDRTSTGNGHGHTRHERILIIPQGPSVCHTEKPWSILGETFARKSWEKPWDYHCKVRHVPAGLWLHRRTLVAHLSGPKSLSWPVIVGCCGNLVKWQLAKSPLRRQIPPYSSTIIANRMQR